MSQSLRNVLLIGASGTVGAHILDALLDDENFSVTILTRSDSASTFGDKAARLRIIRLEYNFDNYLKAFDGQDVVISATSVQSIAIQRDIVFAAHKAGVKRIVLNEFINSPNQSGLPQLEVFRKTKKEVMELAKDLAAKDSTFTWSALATGNFIDYALKKYPVFGFDVRQHKARLIDGGKEPITAVILADIGVAIRGILRRPSETANRFLHIRSTQATQQQILDAFEEVSGTKWDVENESSKELFASGSEQFAQGDRNGMVNLLVVQLFEYGANRSIVVSREKSDNQLLGVREKDIKEIVGLVWHDIQGETTA